MIDLKPAVGRILVRRSFLRDEYFRRGGAIVRMTQFSIFYEAFAGAPVVHIKRDNAAAVCDTPDEVDKLLAFDREMRERRTQAKKQEQLELKRRFGI